MAEWIAFDEADIPSLSRRTQAEVQLGVGDPLTAALDSGAPALVMVRDKPGTVTFIKLRASSAGRPEPLPEAATVSETATGFLGLVDATVFDEPTPPSRSWWRRLFRP